MLFRFQIDVLPVDKDVIFYACTACLHGLISEVDVQYNFWLQILVIFSEDLSFCLFIWQYVL